MAKRFQTLGTADLVQRIFRVEVQDNLLKPSNFPAFLTTYDNWAFDAKERLDDGFGAYVYIGPDEAPAGSSAFLFGPPTAGESKFKDDIIESYPWPAVLTSFAYSPKYYVFPDASGPYAAGDTYIADFFWSYSLKTYNGPTRVRTTRTWSAQKHTVTVPATVLRPANFAHQYYQGTIQIPESLHAAYGPWTLSTKGTKNHPTWGDVSTTLSMSATPHTDWVNHIISNRQEESQGGWLLKTVEAFIPGT